MHNQIEIYEQDGAITRARLLFPRKVEVAVSLAPGDDLAAILQAEHARLATTFSTLPENPAEDTPKPPKAALSTFNGAAWAGKALSDNEAGQP